MGNTVEHPLKEQGHPIILLGCCWWWCFCLPQVFHETLQISSVCKLTLQLCSVRPRPSLISSSVTPLSVVSTAYVNWGLKFCNNLLIGLCASWLPYNPSCQIYLPKILPWLSNTVAEKHLVVFHLDMEISLLLSVSSESFTYCKPFGTAGAREGDS